jgi:hypothetical protein
MKYISSIILLFFLSLFPVYAKDTKSKYDYFFKVVNTYMTSPCIKDLENPARDSIQAIAFLRDLSKKTGVKLIKVKRNNSKEKEFIIYHKDKAYEWSLWVAVGSKGISHITETWQTKNEELLNQKLFHVLLDSYDSWGYPTEENEDNTWVSWDKNKYGCGKLIVTLEYSTYTFVSRRIDFSGN